MGKPIIQTYEEAVDVINELGFLPLAPLFDDYPSLGGVTEKGNWYTDTANDPWKWRTRFAAEGVAAYGKFMKKKAVFISRGLLPLMIAALGSSVPVKERYESGNLSKDALNLFSIISDEEGIDTRVLRVKAGMKDKEKKKAFDQALLELQVSLDIVVSGTKEKQDGNGEKNGWSSTSYETMGAWMKKHNIEELKMGKDAAKRELTEHFSNKSSEQAMEKIKKAIG